jgi:hypothetical protein
MRRFFSYGPIDTEEHYYSPRKELIENAYNQLLGENPQKGGHSLLINLLRPLKKSAIFPGYLQKNTSKNP